MGANPMRATCARMLLGSLLLTTVVAAHAASPEAVRAALHQVPTNMAGVYAFTQPPAGFDPATASPEELASWGYPPKPAASEGALAMTEWQAAVDPRNLRVTPDLVARPGVYHRPVMNLKIGARGAAVTTAISNNWSGFAVGPPASAQPYSLVTAHWIVPTVAQAPKTCSGGWDYSSQWVGLGGFFSGDSFLLQAGSAANVFCDIGNNIPEYFPWIEWLPASEMVLYKNASTETLEPFAPGDYITVTMQATDFSSGVSTSGVMTFVDSTQQWSISLKFTAASLGGSEVTGESAEWIVERTEVNGSFATLPDYFADAWWGTRALDLGNVNHYPGSPGTATAYNITMQDDSSAAVSFVDLLGTQALWFFPEGSATK